MKMSKILSLVLVVVMLFGMTSCDALAGLLGNKEPAHKCESVCPTCGKCLDKECTEKACADKCAGHEEKPTVNPLAGTYEITLWCSELPGVADQFQAQIDAFEAANPGIVINAKVEGVAEGDAASQVIADVVTAPDMYCFAQDQLARLVQASVIAAPSETVADRLKAANDSISISAASVAGTLYAYPLTSDNGYYLYYDTSIISAEDAKSLEAIIAACEASGKNFRYALENAWYTASFFFATGCHSNWTTDAEGKFTSIDDTFNSPEGLIAMKGMQKLAQSDCYNSDNNAFDNAGAIVTGIWHAADAGNHFGANLGATKLPSFTVDGQSYQLGSYSGNKLLGIKPQADGKKALVLSLLAEYLTGEECQLQRYELKQWGPSNLAAQQNESVKSNISLNALAAQNEHAVPQGNISGSWWDIAKVLGADAKAAQSDADLQAALDNYDAAIDAVVSKSDEELEAWSIIGGVNGTSWDTDLLMTKVSDGVWESDAYTFNAGEMFKLRQGGGWDVQVGVANEKTGTTTSGYYARLQNGADEPGNITVETTGKYKIRLEWTEGTHDATVTFVSAE